MDGTGDLYHVMPHNVDCTQHQMAHFLFETHKSIGTILLSALERPEILFITALNLLRDFGKKRNPALLSIVYFKNKISLKKQQSK